MKLHSKVGMFLGLSLVMLCYTMFKPANITTRWENVGNGNRSKTLDDSIAKDTVWTLNKRNETSAWLAKTKKEIKELNRKINEIKNKDISQKFATFETSSKSYWYIKTTNRKRNKNQNEAKRVEELMNIGPFNLLPNYKAPCWLNNTKLQCLPYFFQIGAPKAGTTDLFARIIKHPQVATSWSKEPHWFTRKRFQCIDVQDVDENVCYASNIRMSMPSWTRYCPTRMKRINCVPGPESTLQYYLDHYHSVSIRDIGSHMDSKGYHNKIFGDASCSNLWDNEAWRHIQGNGNLEEPKYTTADIVYHLNPKAKIIVMLRDPVERLFSDYMFFYRKKGEIKNPQSFHDNVLATINYTDTCLRTRSLRQCVYQYHPKQMVRIRIGFYHFFLKEWLRVFPMEQFMIIKLEDYSKNIDVYMQTIFQFLDLESLGSDKLSYISRPDRHKNSNFISKLESKQMFDNTRTILEDYYRPYNDALGQLLGEHFNYKIH